MPGVIIMSPVPPPRGYIYDASVEAGSPTVNVDTATTSGAVTILLTFIVENKPLGEEALDGGYTPPLIDEINSEGVDMLVEATRVDTIRLGDTVAGTGYGAPLIVEIPTIEDIGKITSPAVLPVIGAPTVVFGVGLSRILPAIIGCEALRVDAAPIRRPG